MQPDLRVSIILGPKAEGFDDEFRVEGDPNLVRGFMDWWSESGMGSIAKSMVDAGSCFSLEDEPGCHGGSGNVFGDYLAWRESVADEGRLLVAA